MLEFTRVDCIIYSNKYNSSSLSQLNILEIFRKSSSRISKKVPNGTLQIFQLQRQ